MTTYLKQIFALVAALLLSGCEIVLFPSGDDDPYVRVLPSSELTFSSTASRCSVSIESSGEWTISGAPEWVSVTPDSGDDGAHVTISVLDNELSEERSAVLVVSCDTAEATISIVQEQKVETDYVDMGFDDAGTATQYNDSTGELTVTYSDGNIPDVKVGSAVVLPADYQFDIRVVESVVTEGNSVTMTTTQGNMCNLFRNTSFTLSTTGDTRASGVDGRPVIAPTAVGYLDAEGNYVEVYNEDDAATRADYSESVNLWSWHMDFNGDTLFSGNGGRLWWDKCAFDAGLNGVFNFSFGEAAGNGIFDKVGELEKFSFELTGSVGADMLLRCRYENSAVFKDDRILKYNVIPTGVFTFLVGGVTVRLLVYTHLGQYVELGAGGMVEASGGVAFGMDLRTGLSWTKSGGVVPINEATPHMSIYHPTLKAEASMHGKVSYYPQIEIGLYKFVGPWLEPRPYVREVVQAGFRASTDGENYVAWTDKYFSGMDMRMGLKFDFGFWDKEVWEPNVFNVVDDTPLTTSPERLSLVSPQSGVELEHGESVDVTFMVEGYSPVTGQYWACEDAAVVFETESGELSEGVAISDDKGMVSVTWSPTETGAATQSHTLYARIYSSDGAIIDEGIIYGTTRTIHADERDRDILVKFYEDTGGDNWKYNTNWCSDLPLEYWDGVTTNEEGRVVELWFEKNNLTGGGSLSGLDALEYLDCYHNQLTTLDVSGCTSLVEFDCDHNQLTTLDVSGCTSLVELNCFYNQLTTLDVSDFTALEGLYCYSNQLTTLDASGCTSLVELYCYNNQLTRLDVSGCTSLWELKCNYNNQLTTLDASGCTSLDSFSYSNGQLTTLDFSGCTALEKLQCDDNQLTTLDVSGCTSLEGLYCWGNQLTTLDVSDCTALEELLCWDNQLTTLDVLGCTALWYLSCNGNQLTTLDVSGCTSLLNFSYSNEQLTTLNVSGCTALRELSYTENQLTTLDASGCTSLERLSCDDNQLTTLDVSGCTSLRRLFCHNNQLTTLDVSSCTSLETLLCGGNQLTTLDVSDFTALETLSCSGNQLTTLDVSGCTALVDLSCSVNQLTILDFSGCTALVELYCAENQLTTLDVSGCTALEELYCVNNKISTFNASGCTSLRRLYCKDNKITREISGIFAELDDFEYDCRYTDYWRDKDGNYHWTDNGVGWWWPGEPHSGPHK